jgi:hypothetical protein
MSMILDGSNGVTFNDASLQGAAASPYVLKNRIINGAMVIDQRYAGAAGSAATNTAPYGVDRWVVYGDVNAKFTYQQNAGAVTPPAGFTNYFGMTSTSAYTVLAGGRQLVSQYTEGFNTYDLDFGKATAKTVTLSFWVYSSLTGSFGGALQNYASTRSYPFSYTVSTANTWTQISITIPGDTSGTWVGASAAGSMGVIFSLGSGSTYQGTVNTWASANYVQPTGSVSVVGTNGATFYITGVQLEIGSTATPFERRLYNQELANCQRYFETSFSVGTAPVNNSGNTVNYASTQLSSLVGYTGTTLKVSKRAAPTVTIFSSNATVSPPANQLQYFNNAGAGWTNATSSVGAAATDNTLYFQWANSGVTTGYSYWTQFGWTASAEL